MAEETTNAKKEGTFTYESLYDLFRREKNKEEIQELSSEIYQDVLAYLRDKQGYYDSCMAKSDIFSLSEREKTLQQLQNAKRIIKDLYERREKKIIELALNKSRTNSDLINTQFLLPEEKAFYEMLVHALNTGRECVLIKLLALQNPSLIGSLPNENQYSLSTTDFGQTPSSSKINQHTSLQDTPTNAHVATESTATQSFSSSSTKTKLLKFLSPIDQFLGEELEPYGPYSPEDKAYIPNTLAEILITTGKAKEIEE